MEKSLVILAAGMDSRFGGLKQVEPVGPNGEFIMDYSIYSAIKYGFTKIVFVIRKEHEDLFKSTVGARIKDKVKVEYAFQDINDIPAPFVVPEGRVKPWGTAHAIYSARKFLNEPFGVINSDDFYGDNAFKELSDALDYDDYVIVGYRVGNTLSKNGEVKRGVIINENGFASNIIESSCIKENDVVKCTPLDKEKDVMYVSENQLVSMLINGFNKHMIDAIISDMKTSFEQNQDNLDNFEMLLPDIMNNEIERGKRIKVIDTTSTWMGMTYKEDKENVSNFILKEIDDGVYPNNLWN